MIISILLVENLTHNDHHNMTSSANNEFFLIFLDRSQQVMTIVGVIANIGTSITVIKNGQVSVTLTLIKWPARYHFNSNYNGQVGGTLTLIIMDR